MISDIYYTQSKYDSAVYYFSLADKKYPYVHFCGNAYAAYDVYKAIRYADIYQQLQQPDTALKILLSASFITFADNTQVITELEKILHNQTGLKPQLDHAIENIFSKENHRQPNHLHRILPPLPEHQYSHPTHLR